MYLALKYIKWLPYLFLIYIRFELFKRVKNQILNIEFLNYHRFLNLISKKI